MRPIRLTFRCAPRIMPVRSMRQVTIRLDLRVSEEMNEFLQNEAHSRKLSFEGLLLMLIEEQMKRVKQESQRISPPKP